MAMQTGPAALDEVDLRILRVLRDDGRISMAALAEQVGISRANAYTRVERLRGDGVIEGFSARVAAERVGLGVTAISFLQVRQPARGALAGPLRSIPGIEYAAFVTGEHDVVVTMRARDVQTLRDVTMTRLSAEPSVRNLNTILVLDQMVNRPYLLPDDEILGL